MAIDFMKEHLRKMLTDLDQDLEKYAMGAILAHPCSTQKRKRIRVLFKLRDVFVFVFCLFLLFLFVFNRKSGLPETMSEWGPSTSHRMSGSDSIRAIPLQNARLPRTQHVPLIVAYVF